MLHLKIYDLQWKETQESPSPNILLLRPEIPEPERGSDLPNSSHSEPALGVAFLLFPCFARARVNLLCSEEELQGPNVSTNPVRTHHYNCSENSIRW